MPTVFLPLLGKHVTVTITPQDVDADGDLSDNAIGAMTFVARIDESGIDDEFNADTENIVPMDCPHQNPVLIEQGATFDITEILQALPVGASAGSGSGGVQNFQTGWRLHKALAVSFYQKIVITYKDNAGTTITAGTFYCLFVGRSLTTSRRKATCRGRFATIALPTSGGSYTANPSFSN